MCGLLRRLCAYCGIILLLLLCVAEGTAQAQCTNSESRFRFRRRVKSRLRRSCRAPARSWSFRNAYASALGIAERIEDFRAFGESGQDARVKKSAVGEFRSELDATRVSYTVKLSEPRSEHLPYVSWLDGERGILMFAYLVPTDIENLSCNFTLPVDGASNRQSHPTQTGSTTCRNL